MFKLLFLLLFFINYVFSIETPNTYKAQFKQIIKSNNNKEILYSGNIYISYKEDKIKWDYLEPIEKYVILLNNKDIYNIYVIEPELEQVLLKKEKKINVLSSLKNLEEKNIINNKINYKLNNINYEIELIKDKNIFYVKSINWIDELDNNVNLEFFNIEYNINIDKELYINIPKNYDIIKK